MTTSEQALEDPCRFTVNCNRNDFRTNCRDPGRFTVNCNRNDFRTNCRDPGRFTVNCRDRNDFRTNFRCCGVDPWINSNWNCGCNHRFMKRHHRNINLIADPDDFGMNFRNRAAFRLNSRCCWNDGNWNWNRCDPWMNSNWNCGCNHRFINRHRKNFRMSIRDPDDFGMNLRNRAAFRLNSRCCWNDGNWNWNRCDPWMNSNWNCGCNHRFINRHRNNFRMSIETQTTLE